MAGYTDTAIVQTFLKMAQKQNLSGMTVKRLVEECQINRKTFYYHYQGIDDLAARILSERMMEVVDGRTSPDNWQEGYRDLLADARAHRRLVLNIVTSKYWNEIRNGMGQSIEKLILANIRESYRRVAEEPDRELPERVQKTMLRFYTTLIETLTEDYIMDGMSEEPADYTDYVYTFIHESMYPVFRRFTSK